MRVKRDALDLPSDIACLRQAGASGLLSPSARNAAKRVIEFLDRVLFPLALEKC
jgi:hypothetical protein